MNDHTLALAELAGRNRLRNDWDAYEFQLILWGMGLISTRPNPIDFGQEPQNDEDNLKYVELQARTK